MNSNDQFVGKIQLSLPTMLFFFLNVSEENKNSIDIQAIFVHTPGFDHLQRYVRFLLKSWVNQSFIRTIVNGYVRVTWQRRIRLISQTRV